MGRMKAPVFVEGTGATPAAITDSNATMGMIHYIISPCGKSRKGE